MMFRTKKESPKVSQKYLFIEVLDLLSLCVYVSHQNRVTHSFSQNISLWKHLSTYVFMYVLKVNMFMFRTREGTTPLC